MQDVIKFLRMAEGNAFVKYITIILYYIIYIYIYKFTYYIIYIYMLTFGPLTGFY